MTVRVEVEGSDSGGVRRAAVTKKSRLANGIVAYTEPLRDTKVTLIPFVNETHGADMNINAAFGGTPDQVHNGGDNALWTGANVVGGKASFAVAGEGVGASAAVRVNNPALADVWEFDKTSDVTAANYVAISFAIKIDKDWSAGDSVSIYAWDKAGVNGIVGAAVLVEDYVDEFLFDVYQTATIPFADLGIGVNFDSIRMSLVGKGAGKAPKFYLDTIQVEEAGVAETYATSIPTDVPFYMDSIIFTVAGPLTVDLSWDKFLGLTKLTNGILLTRLRNGDADFSAPLRQLVDFFDFGFRVECRHVDAADTVVTLVTDFPTPLILTGGDLNALTLTIADDLSSLLHFRASARGSITLLEADQI